MAIPLAWLAKVAQSLLWPHISVYDSISNYHYQPFWRQDSFYILEYRLFEDDTHKRIEHVKYIIGSGQHTNSHLISQNEYLTQAPLLFILDPKWDMALALIKALIVDLSD